MTQLSPLFEQPNHSSNMHPIKQQTLTKGQLETTWASAAIGAAAAVLLAACGTSPAGSEFAEQVFVNGKVYAIPLEGRKGKRAQPGADVSADASLAGGRSRH